MTRHINCALVTILLVAISCSGKSIILEEANKKEPALVVEQDDQEIENYVFFKSFQFCDNPYAALTSEEAWTLFTNKKINFDRSNIGELIDLNSYFFEGAKKCIEDELGEKFASAHLVSSNEDSPFNEIALFNDKYLLIAQDGFFFAFKTSDEASKNERVNSTSKSFENTYKKCKTISLPLEYSYDFIMELKDFSKMEQQSIKGLEHLSDFQFSVLPSVNDTKLLLVSGYMESGQSELHLFALNSSYEKIDAILLYTSHETENGSISTRFKISKDHLITIVKEEKGNGPVKLLEMKLVKIKADGTFDLIN